MSAEISVKYSKTTKSYKTPYPRTKKSPKNKRTQPKKIRRNQKKKKKKNCLTGRIKLEPPPSRKQRLGHRRFESGLVLSPAS
jgi:hypothetical protein